MRGQLTVYSVPQPRAVNKCVLASVFMLFTVTVWTYGLELRFGVTLWSNMQHMTATRVRQQRSPVSQQLLQ